MEEKLSGRSPLQKIADKYSVEVARLDRTQISGVSREETRQASDYGRPYMAKLKWLDVMIPFTGEATTLKVAPSSWTIPNHNATINGNHLILSVRDDENADKEVKSFCDVIDQNLNLLRTEYERDKPRLMQRITQVAEQCKKEIEQDNTRDSKLSFPVRR